jgi:hypothetical protein
MQHDLQPVRARIRIQVRRKELQSVERELQLLLS